MSTTKRRTGRDSKFIWFGSAALVLILLAWAGGYHYGKRVETAPLGVEQRIINGSGSPLSASLTAFLTKSIKRSDAQDYCMPGGLSYSVLKQTATQAKLFGRCNDSFPIDAIKVTGNWTLPSITDNFPDYPIPICSYVQQYAISSDVEPYCYQDASRANANMPVIVANTIK